ncbi:uncharacterized protein BN746_02745 [Erysipelotrichaceae bacterium CAG:64]|nr:uncharacterized protein BN746_02745 [Erysipelotrichaceae bacterium CAG:64]
MNGSYPKTSISMAAAALATSTPIAPSPITPSFLPAISGPTKLLFPFSTALEISSPSRVLTHSMPFVILREDISSPAITSSFTALALAPGVLKTTIPCSLQRSSGMLFTPAPALAMHFRSAGNSTSCSFALRTIMASYVSKSSENSYALGSN